MHITEIEVSEPVSAGNGRAWAHVVFKSANQHVVLTAQADEGAGQQAFVDEALRQLRRLPEFRRDAGMLTFAENLLQEAQARCA